MSKSQKSARNIIRNIFLFPVHVYRAAISPFLGPSCIYSPTCSAYMLDAVHTHGIFKGFILGSARILRCNRAFMGGPDPVPDTFSWKQIKNDYVVFHKPRRIKELPDEPTDPSTTP